MNIIKLLSAAPGTLISGFSMFSIPYYKESRPLSRLATYSTNGWQNKGGLLTDIMNINTPIQTDASIQKLNLIPFISNKTTNDFSILNIQEIILDHNVINNQRIFASSLEFSGSSSPLSLQEHKWKKFEYSKPVGILLGEHILYVPTGIIPKTVNELTNSDGYNAVQIYSKFLIENGIYWLGTSTNIYNLTEEVLLD